MESEEHKLKRAVATLLKVITDQPSISSFWDNVSAIDMRDLETLAWEYRDYLGEDGNDGD